MAIRHWGWQRNRSIPSNIDCNRRLEDVGKKKLPVNVDKTMEHHHTSPNFYFCWWRYQLYIYIYNIIYIYIFNYQLAMFNIKLSNYRYFPDSQGLDFRGPEAWPLRWACGDGQRLSEMEWGYHVGKSMETWKHRWSRINRWGCDSHVSSHFFCWSK